MLKVTFSMNSIFTIFPSRLVTHQLPIEVTSVEPMDPARPEISRDDVAPEGNLNNESNHQSISGPHHPGNPETSHNPCPLCGKSDHPIASVNKLALMSQACFFIPNLLQTQQRQIKASQ